MTKETPKEKPVELLPLQLETFKVRIVGDSPLLMHKFGDSQKGAMLDKQTQKPKQKAKRDIEAEVEEATYYLNGNEAIRAVAFKKAMVEVAPYLPGLDKKRLKGSVQVLGDLVPLEFKEKTINEAVVKLSGPGNVSMIRFRPEFHEWGCELTIRYNSALVSNDQIINALNYAGFQIGVGDWRPQCDGSHGMFHVV